MMEFANEEEKLWHQAILEQRDGYLDLQVIRERMQVALVNQEQAQKHIDDHVAAGKDSEYTERGIAFFRQEVDEQERYMQFLEQEFANFPPLPVLPPPAPLVKISGVIEEVTFTKAMACFDAEVYSTARDELERKRQQDNIGALVAMAAQTLAGSPPHAMINDGKPNKLKCLYVKGKIDGKSFSGWFGMTNIRPGDRVEMAAMPDEDNYLVYAIANPEQRTISITPRCYHGSKLPSYLMYFVTFSCLTSPFLLISIGKELSVLFCISFWYLSFNFLSAFLVFKGSRKKDSSSAKLFENICKVLNIPNPERLNLDKVTRLRFKSNSVLVFNGRDMPTKINNDKYFFYY